MQETNASILLLEMPIQWVMADGVLGVGKMIFYCRTGRTGPPSSAKQIRGMIRRDGTRLKRILTPVLASKYERIRCNVRSGWEHVFLFILVSYRVQYYRSGIYAHLQIEALIR